MGQKDVRIAELERELAEAKAGNAPAVSPTRDAEYAAIQEQVETWKARALKAESAKPASTRGLSFKVSPKGCVSIFGVNSLGWHPYAEQYLKISQSDTAIKAFIWENRDKLSWKVRPPEDSLKAMCFPTATK